MSRRILVVASLIALTAAGVTACSPAGRDKAKDEAASAATKAEDAAKSAASDAKVAAVDAKDAVETAAANHGIGVKDTPDFIRTAALSDMFEIRSSELALKRSSDPGVKKFARHMIAAHTKLSHDMKDVVAKEGLAKDLPSDLTGDLKSKLDDLQNAAPEDFDRKYLDDQKGGHEAAVGMFKSYADKGQDAAIKAAAAGAVPVIQSHLDEVKALQKVEENKKSAPPAKNN
jgi:putative membrane protein